MILPFGHTKQNMANLFAITLTFSGSGCVERVEGGTMDDVREILGDMMDRTIGYTRLADGSYVRSDSDVAKRAAGKVENSGGVTQIKSDSSTISFDPVVSKY